MTITAKFGNMRKAVEFTVCPRPTNVGDEYTRVTLQSDHREVVIDTATRKGLLSPHGANYPKVGLAGTVPIEVSQEIVDAALKAQPKKGDVIHGIMVIG